MMTTYFLVMIIWMAPEKSWYSSEMPFKELTQCEKVLTTFQIHSDLSGFAYCEKRTAEKPPA